MNPVGLEVSASACRHCTTPFQLDAIAQPSEHGVECRPEQNGELWIGLLEIYLDQLLGNLPSRKRTRRCALSTAWDGSRRHNRIRSIYRVRGWVLGPKHRRGISCPSFRVLAGQFDSREHESCKSGNLRQSDTGRSVTADTEGTYEMPELPPMKPGALVPCTPTSPT